MLPIAPDDKRTKTVELTEEQKKAPPLTGDLESGDKTAKPLEPKEDQPKELHLTGDLEFFLRLGRLLFLAAKELRARVDDSMEKSPNANLQPSQLVKGSWNFGTDLRAEVVRKMKRTVHAAASSRTEEPSAHDLANNEIVKFVETVAELVGLKYRILTEGPVRVGEITVFGFRVRGLTFEEVSEEREGAFGKKKVSKEKKVVVVKQLMLKCGDRGGYADVPLSVEELVAGLMLLELQATVHRMAETFDKLFDARYDGRVKATMKAFAKTKKSPFKWILGKVKAILPTPVKAKVSGDSTTTEKAGLDDAAGDAVDVKTEFDPTQPWIMQVRALWNEAQRRIYYGWQNLATRVDDTFHIHMYSRGKTLVEEKRRSKTEDDVKEEGEGMELLLGSKWNAMVVTFRSKYKTTTPWEVKLKPVVTKAMQSDLVEASVPDGGTWNLLYKQVVANYASLDDKMFGGEKEKESYFRWFRNAWQWKDRHFFSSHDGMMAAGLEKIQITVGALKWAIKKTGFYFSAEEERELEANMSNVGL